MKRIKFLNTFIDNLTMPEILDCIDKFIQSKKPHHLVAVNAAKIVSMRKDVEFNHIINSCDLIFADGQAIVWASRLLGKPLKQRVAGIDLMQGVIQRASKNKYRLYFLGAKQRVVEQLVNIYKSKFSQLNIVGWHNGYFKSFVEEKKLLKEIKSLRPDVLFVAMSTPEKEYWIRDNLTYLGIPVCMGVGGSFDVVAGFVRRAPEWMQKAGLEWFFRLINEPGRLWKRYLYTNMVFIWLVLIQKIKGDSLSIF